MKGVPGAGLATAGRLPPPLNTSLMFMCLRYPWAPFARPSPVVGGGGRWDGGTGGKRIATGKTVPFAEDII